MLITHNLKAAWRNILKYKVQNTISVLCLSVGVICFAATFVAVKDTHILPFAEKYFNDKIEFLVKRDGMVYPPSLRELKRLQNQQCIKEVDICRQSLLSFFVEGSDGIYPAVYFVNKSWLKSNKYRSINGNNLDDVKNGTMLIENSLIEKYPNKDCAKECASYVNTLLGKYYKHQNFTVSDTISSPTLTLATSVFIVSDFTDVPNELSNIDLGGSGVTKVVLNRDFTKMDLYNCAKRIFPKDCKIIIMNADVPTNMDFLKMLSLALFIMFIGTSVLMVGLSGYLKMQFQLFALRSREIMLRRCNGAKTMQLFQLLCTELGITFLAIIVISIIITAGLSSYTSTITETMIGNIKISTDTLLPIEITITIIALVISIGIAWLRVRKVLNVSPNSTINHCMPSKSRWNSIMQIVQYSIAASLIYFVVICYLSSIIHITESHPYQSYDKLKKTIYISNCESGIEDTLRSLPTVDQVAEILQIRYTGKSKQFPELRGEITGVSSEDTFYVYGMKVIDSSILPIYNIKIQDSSRPNFETPEDTIMIPVFANAEDIDSISKEIDLTHKASMQEMQLPDSGKYVKLGYMKPIDGYYHGFPHIHSFYVISDIEKYYYRLYNMNITNVHCDCIFTIKGDEKDKADIIKKIKTMYVNPNMEIECVYDRDYHRHKVSTNTIKICNILMVTCLICIILTIYSSITLETRGRQKEVAIRKVNGAKTKDIIKLFSRNYVKTLAIAFVIGFIFPLIWNYCLDYLLYIIKFPYLRQVLTVYCVAFFIIVLVTLLTVWQKIYKISHINPALLIKKE